MQLWYKCRLFRFWEWYQIVVIYWRTNNKKGMLCKRCFLIINFRLKGFSLFWCDWFLSGTREGCWNRSQCMGQVIQGPMWAVGGGLPCSRAPRQRCEGVLAFNNTSQRTIQGATAPITFIMPPTPISTMALVHLWMSQCCDGGDGVFPAITAQVQREQHPSCQCHHRAATNSLAII